MLRARLFRATTASPDRRFPPPENPAGPAFSAPAWSRRDLLASVALALLCLLIYNANLRTIGSGDTLPARYLPFSLWHNGTVRLDPIFEITKEGSDRPYWIVPGRGDHWIALYPVVLPVLVAPLYLPAVAYLDHRGWTERRFLRLAVLMEKLTASLIATAAVALLYRLLRRRAAFRDALLLTFAFAFGTNTWMIGSQALWQHGLAELLLVGALLLLTGECTAPRALAAGLLCGLVAGNRPPDALFAAALGLYGLLWAGRRRAAWLVAGATVPAGLVLFYNLVLAGNLAGGYGVPLHDGFFHNNLLEGVAGLLVSPTKGLLVFSPFLLLAPAAFRLGLRDLGTRTLTLLLGAAMLVQLLVYAKADWRAGFSWGPRWLTDLLPLLLWMLPPALAGLRGFGRSVFAVAIGASIAIQAVGAFWYTGASDTAIETVGPGREEMRAAWDPRNAPFLTEPRHDRAPHDPAFGGWRKLEGARGDMDSVTAIGGSPRGEGVTARTPLAIEGWALLDGRVPDSIEVDLDGQLRATTTTYFDRPDVRTKLHSIGAAGWHVELLPGAVAPGAHVLTAVARTKGSAAVLPGVRWSLTIVADRAPGGGAIAPAAPDENGDLEAMARRAASLLEARQQPQGFWLTSYTGAPRFAGARFEMNAYLTAITIDLLDPIAATTGLGESVARARAHLAGQIEADGLVRYHGRPDALTIPSLGCAITPDADDTALVWRLAGGARKEGLAGALATLAKYRTPEGLYRTWLAPIDRYQCLDPGKDPDPADGGIQMHVLLFLAKADPPAARALCDALGRAVAENRGWVYYEEAPLVPILRQADLRRAGCPLCLPAARLRTPVADQEIWLAAGLQLDRLRAGETVPAAETLAVLRHLAKDDFVAIRSGPPLLYHNDLTAGTRRFYWSEDFGYALWLRLYREISQRNAGTTTLP